VYHGTILRYAIDICTNGINLTKSSQYLDFGRGFYTTDNIEMAKDYNGSVVKTKIKDFYNELISMVARG
jgi:hypothetical protein